MTIDTKRMRADFPQGLSGHGPVHALCDEVDRLTASLAEQDAAAMAAIDETATKASAMAIVAIKETAAHFGEERDQLAAEMAEARKTVEALGRQAAALRAALQSVVDEGSRVDYVIGIRNAHVLPPTEIDDVRAILADTPTAAQGYVAVDDALIDRVLLAVCNTHDESRLWEDTRRDPSAFRNAVHFALKSERAK